MINRVDLQINGLSFEIHACCETSGGVIRTTHDEAEFWGLYLIRDGRSEHVEDYTNLDAALSSVARDAAKILENTPERTNTP